MPSERPFDWGTPDEVPEPWIDPEREPPTVPELRFQGSGGFQPPVDDSPLPLGVKVAAALAFVTVVALVVTVSIKVAVRDGAPARGQGGGATDEATSVVRGLGPAPGADLVAYLENRRQALGVATGERVAVVSLGRYTTESEAWAFAAGMPVKALLAATPGGLPATVTTGLGTWLDGEQSAMRSERDEIQKLLPTVTDDPEFKADYERRVTELTDALDSVKADGALVFGLVVEGRADVLRSIGAGPGVRAVDVAPPAAPRPDSDYRGVRPEETVKANDPPTRPV